MTEEYLKMADAFREVVQPERFNYAMANPKATYAAHAINSHDELVADVERLRESNKRMAKAIWSKWERDGIFTHNSEGQADIFRELYLCDPSSDSATE